MNDPYNEGMRVDDDEAAMQASRGEAWLGLDLKVGEISDEIKAQRRRHAASIPIRGPRQKAAPFPAAGALVLDLGTPAMGRRWRLCNLSITDAADATVAVTGTAAVYVGNHGVYSPAALRWLLPALPACEKFGADEIGVIPADHLFVVISGSTAGQVLLARAEILDYPLTLPKPVMPL